MMSYKANIDITVGGQKFSPGERITKSISKSDVDFLLREEYIEKIPSPVKETGKPNEKPGAEKEEKTSGK